jgi:hypothetical protein
MDFTLTAEQRELIFENARVPHANIVDEINGNGRIRGAGALSSGDMFGDLELAANAFGVCDSAYEQALAYVKSHQQGGRPLIEQQLVQLKINRMHMLTEALRSFVLWVAWEHGAKIHSANPLCQCRPGDELFEQRHPGGDGDRHGHLRRRRRPNASGHRQAGARRHDLDPPRGRHRTAHAGRPSSHRQALGSPQP